MELILLLATVYVLTFLIGIVLSKIKIPWVFAALLVGLIFAISNPFPEATSSPTFLFLARLGMYFLLFIIGFELNLNELSKSGKFLVKAATLIVLLEAFFGTLIIHFVFGVPWIISLIIGVSFATVGEALLAPILEEFKMFGTKLGQTIIGIATVDDIFEVVTLVFAVFLFIGAEPTKILFPIISLFILVALSSLIIAVGGGGLKRLKKFKIDSVKRFEARTKESLIFVLILFIFFIFIGIGQFGGIAPLGALLAGLGIRNLIPERHINKTRSQLKILTYSLLAPLFFVSIGLDISLDFFFLPAILLIMVVVNTTKISSSWIVGRKMLGTKKSILMGIALSVKFSVSIIIIRLLFEHGLIGIDLYSILIGTTIFFKFVVPFLFSYLFGKWKIKLKPIKNKVNYS